MRADLAPIAVFAYNRPEHVLRTLESLTANTLANQSTLYVFADGPRTGATDAEIVAIHRTRDAIRSRQWCRDVSIIEAETNKGLATSILDGVTMVIRKHGKIIVLEDDLVVSSGFLRYMNDALALYEEDDRVMQISGFALPVIEPLQETFFYSHATSWGWATWDRVWKTLETDDHRLLGAIQSSGREREFDLGGSYEFSSHLRLNIDRTIDTWAIKLVATIFLNHGLCLYPHKSLVRNIGLDGTGVHSGEDKSYWIPTLADRVTVQRIPLELDAQARESFAQFYRERESRLSTRTLTQKLRNGARTRLARLRLLA